MIRSRINMARQGHRFHIAPFPSKEKLSNHWAVLVLVCFVTSFWRRNLVLDFDKTLTCLQPCASILRISFIVLSYFLDIFSSILSPFYFAPNELWIILLKIWIYVSGFKIPIVKVICMKERSKALVPGWSITIWRTND